MIALWITYAKDRLPLVESVAQLRAVAPAAKIHIIDDAADPLPQDTLDIVNPDRYAQTTWSRGGNLRGWDCVLGILDELAKSSDGSGILKIDSDTLVMSLEWLHKSSPHSGICMGGNTFCSGMAYWLRSDAISEIRASLLGRWRNPAMRVPEDVTISTEALRIYGKECQIHHWCEGIAHGWQYNDELDEAKAPGKQIITFGNRSMIKDCKCGDEKRERVALAMHKYRKRF